VSGELYNSLVRQLFIGAGQERPMEQAGEALLVGEAGSVARGTWVRLKLKIQDARVTDARFRVYGCPHTVAATAWLAQQVFGRSANALLPEGIATLCRPLEVPVEKLGRLLVIEDVVRICERQAADV
jgi:NifU-like protein involved in Fe-S cluster formation